MKKYFLYFLLLIFICINITGCANRYPFFMGDSESADYEFSRLLSAIEAHDAEALKNLFSYNVQEAIPTLDDDIVRFLEILDGEIISHTSPEERGVNRRQETDHGKIRIFVKGVSTLETPNGIFHIAFRYCTIDTFDHNNEGFQSINIVNDSDLKEDSLYKWDNGVTFGADSRKTRRAD